MVRGLNSQPVRLQLVLSLAILLALPALAQQSSGGASSSGGLEEIVVTATRREESIQTVPMSITAVTVAALERKAATQFFDYASAIPNLSFGYSGGDQSAGVASSREIAIRGIAGDGTTAFYVDDTQIGRAHV